mmetsp:Transcript_21013/g.27246  ORF Transcript_21013/g.27246 Transcript_21013/m.27246 type:complete len:154 (-) Transcript_21013:98-559(-)
MMLFEKYSWDQTGKTVTIYLPYEDAKALEGTDEIKCEFGERSVEFRVREKEFKILNLCQKIDSTKSKLMIKSDRFQIKLFKFEKDKEWSALDDEIDKKKEVRAKRVAEGDLKNASTQELLADMFANATDEERLELRKAAAQGAKVREGKGVPP